MPSFRAGASGCGDREDGQDGMGVGIGTRQGRTALQRMIKSSGCAEVAKRYELCRQLPSTGTFCVVHLRGLLIWKLQLIGQVRGAVVKGTAIIIIEARTLNHCCGSSGIVHR